MREQQWYINELLKSFELAIQDLPSSKKEQHKTILNNAKSHFNNTFKTPTVTSSTFTHPVLKKRLSQPMCVIPEDPLVKSLQKIAPPSTKKSKMEKITQALSDPNIPIPTLHPLPQNIPLTDFAKQINSIYAELLGVENNRKCKSYELEKHLRYAKQYCLLHNIAFVVFIENSLTIKSISHINNYIAFYKIVRKYPMLLNCELTFTEIVFNRKHSIYSSYMC